MEQDGQIPAVARKWHVLGFALLAGAGGYATAVSLGLGLWRQNSPGEGLFPFIAAVAVTTFSLAGLAGMRGRWPAAVDGATLNPRATVIRLAAYLTGLIFYAAALDALGFIVSTVLVVIFILRIAEGHGWRTSVAISAGTAAGCHLLFVYLLGAILPTGFLWDRLIY